MAYSDFTIERLKTEFNLTIIEKNDIIKSQPVNPSNWLHETLFGVVTTGSVWWFLKLENNVAIVDLNEVYLTPVDKLFGLLSATLKN